MHYMYVDYTLDHIHVHVKFKFRLNILFACIHVVYVHLPLSIIQCTYTCPAPSGLYFAGIYLAHKF